MKIFLTFFCLFFLFVNQLTAESNNLDKLIAELENETESSKIMKSILELHSYSSQLTPQQALHIYETVSSKTDEGWNLLEEVSMCMQNIKYKKDEFKSLLTPEILLKISSHLPTYVSFLEHMIPRHYLSQPPLKKAIEKYIDCKGCHLAIRLKLSSLIKDRQKYKFIILKAVEKQKSLEHLDYILANIFTPILSKFSLNTIQEILEKYSGPPHLETKTNILKSILREADQKHHSTIAQYLKKRLNKHLSAPSISNNLLETLNQLKISESEQKKLNHFILEVLNSDQLSREQKTPFLSSYLYYLNNKNFPLEKKEKDFLAHIANEEVKRVKANNYDEFTQTFLLYADQNEPKNLFGNTAKNIIKDRNKKMGLDKPEDFCKIVCHILDKSELWTASSHFESGVDKDLPHAQNPAWKFTFGSMALTSLLRARKYCPGIDTKKTEQRLTTYIKDKKIALSENIDPHAFTLTPKKNDLKKATSLQSTSDFFSKVYGNELLKTLKKNNYTKTYQPMIQSKLVNYLEDSESLQGGVEGSLIHHYGLSSATLSLDSISPQLQTKLQNIYNEATIKDGMPLISYNSYGGFQTIEESLPRSIVFMLALIKHNQEPKKEKKYKEQLFKMIQRYSDNINSYTLTHLRRGTHSGDRQAPFYFLPTLPYVTAGLRWLSHDEFFSDKKDKMTETKNRLARGIKYAINNEGLFHTMAKSDYSNSHVIVNSLGILSLLPLIDSCRDQQTSPSLGILEESTFFKIEKERHINKKIMPQRVHY